MIALPSSTPSGPVELGKASAEGFPDRAARRQRQRLQPSPQPNDARCRHFTTHPNDATGGPKVRIGSQGLGFMPTTSTSHNKRRRDLRECCGTREDFYGWQPYEFAYFQHPSTMMFLVLGFGVSMCKKNILCGQGVDYQVIKCLSGPVAAI